jgi:hypothetical protein
MSSIKTLNELFLRLDSGHGYDGMNGILKELDLDKEEIMEYTHWNPSRYTRNKLYGTPSMEVLLLCFEEGQESRIHDLDSQQGWVYVIEGELTKEQYVWSEVKEEMFLVQSVNLSEGSFTYENDYIGFHKGVNAHKGRTVCLVFYAEPVRKTVVYNEQTGDFAEVLPYYDLRFDRATSN